MYNKYQIADWTGRILESHGVFETFDDAEEYLIEFLGDAYNTDRQEYFIF